MNIRFAFCSLLFVAACHHGGSVPADMTPPPDLTPPGDMATPFPAVAHPDVPQLQNEGGPVMSAPKVVVITFPGEDHLSDIETFVSTLGDQPYWATATGEYGVGKVTMLASYQDPTAPPTMITDQQIETYIANLIATPATDMGTPVPQPDDNTVYAVFYPSTTTIDDGSGATSCNDFGGYHADFQLASGQEVIYAVLPRCTGVMSAGGDFGYLTSATSHELIEASEDPFPFTNPGYADTDDAHFSWEIALGGGEGGDLCAQNLDADFQPDGFGYWVQRSWSNIAAKNALDPCVPAPAGENYVNITPVTPYDKVMFGGGTVDAFEVVVGVPRTIEFEIFSQQPMDTPATVGVVDYGALQRGTSSKLTLDWDTKTGINGSKLNLTINPTGVPAGHSSSTTLFVKTKANGVTRFWFGFVKVLATPPDGGTTAPVDMAAP